MYGEKSQAGAVLPGDHHPLISPDPTADALARVYALILSWPLPEEDERALHLAEEAE